MSMYELKLKQWGDESVGASVFFDHVPEGEGVVVVDGGDRGDKVSLFEFIVFEGDSPAGLVTVIAEGSFDHVQGHSDNVSSGQLGAVVGACGIAVVAGLPVVDGPPVDSIREGLFQVRERWAADSDFDELPLVDEDFEVVSPSFGEDLCAHRGLEAVSFD